jgi:hypothetical protein
MCTKIWTGSQRPYERISNNAMVKSTRLKLECQTSRDNYCENVVKYIVLIGCENGP